jgi:hypothetical protein
VPPDRDHDRLGTDPAPLDDPADSEVANPARQGIDRLLFLSLEPLAQRFFGAVPHQGAHGCVTMPSVVQQTTPSCVCTVPFRPDLCRCLSRVHAQNDGQMTVERS